MFHSLLSGFVLSASNITQWWFIVNSNVGSFFFYFAWLFNIQSIFPILRMKWVNLKDFNVQLYMSINDLLNEFIVVAVKWMEFLMEGTTACVEWWSNNKEYFGYFFNIFWIFVSFGVFFGILRVPGFGIYCFHFGIFWLLTFCLFWYFKYF